MVTRPMSHAYALDVANNDYVFHIGDTVEAGQKFTETTERPYMLALQGTKKKKLVFTSSDESVAVVDESGHIEAVGEGDAVITAAVSDLVQEIRITSYVPGEKIGFEEEEYHMNCGEEMDITAVVQPSNAVLFDEIRYKSMNTEIVTVDEKGHLTAGEPGNTQVLVYADGLFGRAIVNIYQPMTAIEFAGIADDEVITLERGDTYQFSINYFPENTTDDRTITYTLSDPEAGTIDEDGLFTATGRGPVTLTATCGKFTDTVELYVKVSLTGIEINHTSKDMSYPDADQLTFVTIPEDTTAELNVSWMSENTNVIVVDENGTVTAKGGGTADVVLNVNGFEQRCTYSVVVPITGINISNTALTMYTGTNGGLKASVVPSFTTEDKTITWTSDNPGIVTVNNAGGIAALSPGTTVIHATHGKFQANCTITVVNRPTWEETADAIIAYGRQFLGTPYVYGGNSLRGGIDCSGFTQQCFASRGIGLARTSYTQVNQGTPVSLDPSAWRKGDLIFYSRNGRVFHVGIYIGGGQILQSAESQGGVCITSYNYNGMSPSHVRRYF